MFESYISNRKQCVVINGTKSDLLDIQAGVPQGSRLGPLLFLIYINDIVEGLESEILIFADDCSLLASGLDPTETVEIINRHFSEYSIGQRDGKLISMLAKQKISFFLEKSLITHHPWFSMIHISIGLTPIAILVYI